MGREHLSRDDEGRLIRYVWPGGYPLFYLDKRDNVLCWECAVTSDREVIDWPDQAPVVCDANWEDPWLFCDQCSERIESAYAEGCHEDPPDHCWNEPHECALCGANR